MGFFMGYKIVQNLQKRWPEHKNRWDSTHKDSNFEAAGS
jgi:hypothetical protein